MVPCVSTAAPFDAVLFDAGGVLVLPDPPTMRDLLVRHGGSDVLDHYHRAHYAGMHAKSTMGSAEPHWDHYNLAYLAAVGVVDGDLAAIAAGLGAVRTADTWSFPIPDSVAALRDLAELGVPMGVVSNASGQIEAVLAAQGICQVGPGPAVEVRVVVDSHVVGLTKPDPRIFDLALAHFPGVERSRIAYVGDSYALDVVSSRAAGLHPILIDPHEDHRAADVERITTLADLVARWT